MSAPDVRIGQWGKIISGLSAGSYVLVQGDQEASGGYLILTSAAPELKAAGHDNWVENRTQVEEFFVEAQWKIDWL
jgi:hypothetical protein